MIEAHNYKIYTLSEPGSEMVRYVGLTGRDINFRLHLHVKEKRNNHKCNWINGLLERGLSPEINLLEDSLSGDEAKSQEREYIKLFKSMGARLVNTTIGGEGMFGYKHSEDSKKRIALAHIGKKRPRWIIEKMAAANRAKVYSEEERMQRALRRMGQKTSEETKEKQRQNCFKGRKHTEESKEKNRVAHLGKKLSLETISKIALNHRTKRSDYIPPDVIGEKNPMYGKTHTESARKKIRNARTNSKMNEFIVKDIRKRYSNGNISCSKLATLFDVNIGVIQRIVTNKTWKEGGND